MTDRTDTAPAAPSVALRLAALVLVVFVWMAAVGATVVYACRPGCAGAVLLVLLVTCVGWGFVGEARQSLSDAL